MFWQPKNQFVFKLLALLLVGSLFIKSLIYLDDNGDTWIYHLPFAARLWGLVTPNEYILEYERELIYQGFPKLANFLQGFFWWIAGIEQPQAANLVSFFSLVGYCVFLRSYLKIPLYLSILGLLAVPLIHIAATACYVDLFCNVFVAILILMTYLLYVREDFLNWRNFILFSLAGAAAANTKYLTVPPIAIILVFVIGRVIFLYARRAWGDSQKIAIFILGLIISNSFIFATEIKNTIIYQNPFYPLKIQIAGVVLNHAIEPSEYMSPYLKSLFPAQRWLYSLLEIGAFDDRRPWHWTIAMDFIPLSEDSFGVGGYMAAYVVFNIILFFYLCRQKNHQAKIALAFFTVMSLITAILPYSYQLRYYMYWIMVLIALNLYLASQLNNSSTKSSIVTPHNIGVISTSAVIVFCILTKWNFTLPTHHSLPIYIGYSLDTKVFSQIEDGEEVCLVGFAPRTFLYNSKFNPTRHYSVKAEAALSPDYVEEKCGSRRIIENK
ncbi:hypothetical protein IQ249_18060 [Lusitaniella coriacea LEGE 07157]|uniref:Uncharacterized protein n=1 Tax=Lusitaniella coriacea LEGE 07157 TaxID=945747 RepID=A0A8J7DYV3_9CYAN|nr:hypothetical protein [Lusitaniella coriacea]MBE9117807.1 hypothetical protein [Lusitaniella coriacea LEGE 07157]